ncbi:hypothetical protein PAC01_17760 [Pediococcus acidilactici]|nr:hypothetical protein PAC01_17760 [Pediococcus acidilactici]
MNVKNKDCLIDHTWFVKLFLMNFDNIEKNDKLRQVYRGHDLEEYGRNYTWQTF